MALQARHRYIVAKLNECFEINDEEATEDLVRVAPILEKINHFFSGDGPSRLLFYLIRGATDPFGNEIRELIVSDGSNMPKAAKVVFFMKTVKYDEHSENRVRETRLKHFRGVITCGAAVTGKRTTHATKYKYFYKNRSMI